MLLLFMLPRHWQFNTLTQNLALLNLTLVLPYILCAYENSFHFKDTIQSNFSQARIQIGQGYHQISIRMLQNSVITNIHFHCQTYSSLCAISHHFVGLV